MKLTKTLKSVLVFLLIGMFASGYGIYSHFSQNILDRLLSDAYLFYKGDPHERANIFEKLINDFNIKPSRHFVPFELKANRAYKELNIQNLHGRRDNPQYYIDEGAEEGYRLIGGAMDFENRLHGAFLMNNAGEILNTWEITEDGLAWEHQEDTNLFPHTFLALPDGSLVFVFSNGQSIQRIDACGNRMWSIDGHFHHSIAREGDEFIWTWLGNSAVKLSLDDGQILKRVSLNNIRKANHNIDPLGLREQDSLNSSSDLFDPYHPNDVDPLPESLADQFPMFNSGDLLMSIRSQNLVFIVDPETHKIKWWRVGPWRRQHDPDWLSNGRISVFDNNMHRGVSRIFEIDPNTHHAEVVVDGNYYNFYSWAQGKHEVTPNGNVIISSAQQARIFELDTEGNVVFELVNTYSSDTEENLTLSEGRFYPLDYFDDNVFTQCNP